MRNGELRTSRLPLLPRQLTREALHWRPREIGLLTSHFSPLTFPTLRSAARGFTLLEILVVLGMLAVAAGLIVPRMGRSLEQRELHEAAARFAHTARTVREFAISTAQTCALEIDVSAGAYGVVIESGDSAGGQGRAVQASWLKSERWPATIRIGNYRSAGAATAGGSSERLRFFPDGTSSGATFRLETGDDAYTIVVHPQNGQVQWGHAAENPVTMVQFDLGD